jgi:hypothetical protein
MPKERPSGRKNSQHEKFVKLARDSGADESEDAFVRQLRKLAKLQPKPSKSKGS